MNPEAIRFWADVGAIFLLVNVFLLTLVMGAALGFGWWYLRKGRKALAMPLRMGQVYALRVQQVTMKVTDAIANMPIQLHGAATQIKTTAQTVVRGRSVS